MQRICLFYNAEVDIRNFRAPTNKIYEIHGYHWTNEQATAGTLVVSSKLTEDQVAQMSRDDNTIFAVDVGLDGAISNLMLPIPVRTKFLSVGPSGVNAITGMMIIYYTLDNAKKEELVWEFIKRGKSP